MKDTRRIEAETDMVWQALLNPAVLQASVPGCESLTGSADEGFEAVVVQKVGPVKARFTGAVTLTERVEGESLYLSGEGKGGAAGFAKGGARVRLEADGAATLLHYEVEAKVGGKLAQLGSRIIDGFARKMADEFFSRFQQAVEGPGDAAADADAAENDTGEAVDAAEGSDADQPAGKKGWFRNMLGR